MYLDRRRALVASVTVGSTVSLDWSSGWVLWGSCLSVMSMSVVWSRAALAVLWFVRCPSCSSGGREAPSAMTTAPLGSLSAGCSVGVQREGLAACSRLCSPAKGEGGWLFGWGWGGVARSAWLGLAWARGGLVLAVARMGSSCSARSVAGVARRGAYLVQGARRGAWLAWRLP